jgi:3-oxoadipate CoA-transferase beta subunit
MDLAIGAKDVFVMMTLFAKNGAPKLVPALTYPVTGVACVTRVYTPEATLLLERGSVVVRETFGTTLDELRSRVGVALEPVY